MLGLNNGAQQWVSGDSTDSYVLSMDTVVPVLNLPRINLPTNFPFHSVLEKPPYLHTKYVLSFRSGKKMFWGSMKEVTNTFKGSIVWTVTVQER